MADLISLNKSYTYAAGSSPNVSPNGAYPDTNSVEATDGIIGAYSQSDVAHFGVLSAGYNPPTGGCNITIDLGATYTLDHARVYYYDPGGGIAGPSAIVIKGSTDNVNFDTLGSFSAPTDFQYGTGTSRWTSNLSISGNYRYIEFITTNSADWCFLDEFEVYGSAGGAGLSPLNIRIGQRQGVEID